MNKIREWLQSFFRTQQSTQKKDKKIEINNQKQTIKPTVKEPKETSLDLKVKELRVQHQENQIDEQEVFQLYEEIRDLEVEKLGMEPYTNYTLEEYLSEKELNIQEMLSESEADLKDDATYYMNEDLIDNELAKEKIELEQRITTDYKNIMEKINKELPKIDKKLEEKYDHLKNTLKLTNHSGISNKELLKKASDIAFNEKPKTYAKGMER